MKAHLSYLYLYLLSTIWMYCSFSVENPSVAMLLFFVSGIMFAVGRQQQLAVRKERENAASR